MLGIFWWGHWLWSRRYSLKDGASIIISWGMIVTILIFIYPLKAIFGAMWSLLSDGRVGQPLALHTTEPQARQLFALYALVIIAVSAEVLLLNLRAWQLRESLRLNAREKLMTRAELTGWSIPVSVGIVSLVLSREFADRKNRMERLGLFLHGDSGAAAPFLLQRSTESERDSKLKKQKLRTETMAKQTPNAGRRFLSRAPLRCVRGRVRPAYHSRPNGSASLIRSTPRGQERRSVQAKISRKKAP